METLKQNQMKFMDFLGLIVSLWISRRRFFSTRGGRGKEGGGKKKGEGGGKMGGERGGRREKSGSFEVVLRGGISMRQSDLSSGTVTWLAYRRNATRLVYVQRNFQAPIRTQLWHSHVTSLPQECNSATVCRPIGSQLCMASQRTW